MILDVAYSLNGVPIRLTNERWYHIIEERTFLSSYYERILDAIERPTYVLPGTRGSLIAVVPLARAKYLYVVYKELNQDDGFIITATIERRVNKKKAIWRAE